MTTVQKTKAAVKKPTTSTGIKPYVFRGAETRHLGDEPSWTTQPTEKTRASELSKAFTWYNYYFDKKEAKIMLLQWLEHGGRKDETKTIKGVSDSEYSLTHCWLARMNTMGLELRESELAAINNVVTGLKYSKQEATQTAGEIADEAEAKKVTIQDRLREKVVECASEIDGLFDTFVKEGAKMSASYKPIALLRGMNVVPQMVGYISDIWKKELAEFEAVVDGSDKELTEGYDKYTKTQMKNFVKFAEQVISDCQSYLQVKKSERKPRAKKAVSPEKLAMKFKYLREFPQLKLKSEPPSKLVAAQEAWLYNTATRKIIHVVADLNAGSLTIKGASIVGFDEVTSVQKTLRKPAEQLKELLGGGKPASRKWFKDIKATEIKFNGRSNENVVILKVW